MEYARLLWLRVSYGPLKTAFGGDVEKDVAQYFQSLITLTRL